MLAFRPAANAAGVSGPGGSKTGKSKAPAARSALPSATTRARAPERTAAATATWTEPDWGALVAQLGLDGAVRLLASNCVYRGRTGQVISLGLDPRSESMLTRKRVDVLAETLSRHFGESLKVDIELGADEGETPVQEESRLADERMEAARQSLEADPNVQAMKNMFGAELKTDTIELIQTPQTDQGNN
jgi:DNA polymerase-3 subunit gamma/tau